MEYITRDGGATVTVFVPYDCNNKCPFCINKQEYEDTSRFNLREIIRSIRIMSAMTPTCDFVFTGGEPLANCVDLEEMLMAVHLPGTNHKVFINTSLPTKDADGQPTDYLVHCLNDWYGRGLITGINVSRHLKKYVEEQDDEIFELLDFTPRINCVLYNIHLTDSCIITKLIDFVERFKDITSYVQFRKDYTITTLENLYDEEGDEILNLLKSAFDYVGTFGQYRMRCGYEFKHQGYKVTYHKTLPYSKIALGNDKYVLYDVIIKQDGEIREDWDVTIPGQYRGLIKAAKLDLTAYKDVTYENYM